MIAIYFISLNYKWKKKQFLQLKSLFCHQSDIVEWNKRVNKKKSISTEHMHIQESSKM